MKDYPPRFLWKVVLSAAPKNDLTLSIRLSSTSGNGSTMTFPGHSQTIPKTPTAADGTITIGPVTDGAGPIEIWIDPTDPNKFADISFEIADSTEKDKIKTIAIPHAVMQGLWNTAINTYEALPGVSDTCLGFAAVDATPGTVGLWGVPLFTGLDCGALKTMNACKNPSQTFGVDETWMDEELGQKWLTADSDYYGGAYGKQQVHRYFAAVNACTGKEINMGVLNALWLKESIASNRYIPNGEMGALLTEGVTAMVKEYNEVTLPVEQLTDPTLKPIDLPDKFMISWTGDFGVNWTWQLLEDELPEVKTAILDLLKLFAKGYPDDPDNKIPAEFFIGPYDPQLGREAQYDTSQNGQAPQHTSAIDTAMAALSDLIFEKQYGWITDTEDFYFFRNEIPFGCDQAVADFFGKECDGALTNVTDRQIEVAIAAKFKTGYCNEPKALAQGAAYVENLAVVFSFLDTGCCFPASFTDTTCPASCGGGTPLPPTPVNCNNATDPCKDKKTGERCTLVGEEIKICTAPPDSPNPTECECKVIN
ncbi:hypothetical protein AUK40_04285 [Candidatus Wirthbacteria bacterium CG2_30_54_11]|uniref:Uncharacterized protein n=1 Tax=Candidatus Wirthbacteria bacterium CG2_30_54_11 TaxID=1817892 RepID=A0A1J5IIK6_9BACT|nr:MAG: hypothetical protein AUK40_04285 [Candidatus Wirthbacteria bacterium CG2_30_54_11]